METAQSLGIHGAIEYHLEVLVSCTGVADFPRQAEFHPLKFIDILARQLIVCEYTLVTDLEDHCLKQSVRADKIVIATHFPFINFLGMYFTRIH